MECNAVTFVFVLFLVIITVQGEMHVKNLEKLAIKTIESEDGDVIHCVDIYKQPAFDHPLLQNHTVEMPPTSYQGIEGIQSSSEEIFQVWQKSGSCPEGTIPIRKTSEEEDGAFKSFDAYGSTSRRLLALKWKSQPAPRMEFAGLYNSPDKPYTGVRGRMSLWTPQVVGNERSGAAISIHGKQSSVYLGWMVRSHIFDRKPRPRTFIALEGEGGELCFNLRCPGFVQTSNRMVLDGSLLVSKTSNAIPFVIFKDYSLPKWWAVVGKEYLGYWPDRLVGNLFPFEIVRWTGFVQSRPINGSHTSTQMGNGQRPENSRNAAFIDDISLIESSGEHVAPLTLEKLVSFPRCYYAVIYEDGRTTSNEGTTVHYGGTGTKGCDRPNLIRNREQFNG